MFPWKLIEDVKGKNSLQGLPGIFRKVAGYLMGLACNDNKHLNAGVDGQNLLPRTFPGYL